MVVLALPFSPPLVASWPHDAAIFRRRALMDKAHFIAACRRGGQPMAEALRQLQRDYGRPLLAEARAVLGEWAAAQDLLQDTLIKAWQRCAQYRGDAELYPWLKSVLRHGALDQLRRRQDERPLSDPQGRIAAEVEQALQRERANPGPEQQSQARQLESVYRDCQARFQREQPAAASVVRWIAEDGLTPEELSRLLQRSPGATREYLSQCRKKARVYFREWYLLATQADDPPTTASAPAQEPER